jgi:hypothetical protein
MRSNLSQFKYSLIKITVNKKMDELWYISTIKWWYKSCNAMQIKLKILKQNRYFTDYDYDSEF